MSLLTEVKHYNPTSYRTKIRFSTPEYRVELGVYETEVCDDPETEEPVVLHNVLCAKLWDHRWNPLCCEAIDENQLKFAYGLTMEALR